MGIIKIIAVFILIDSSQIWVAIPSEDQTDNMAPLGGQCNEKYGTQYMLCKNKEMSLYSKPPLWELM